jgi:pimeloyl-ACP methyl ester carboxylesterase
MPKSVRVNDVEIHYAEAGQGAPLVLLHAGLMSSGAAWAGHPGAYATYMDAFARHFRVIAPDTRGHGRTQSPARGAISFAELAADVIALITALDLGRPMVCGFSDGGTIATVVALTAPGSVRALVNDAGFDLFHPNSPSFGVARGIFGGRPDATQPNPEVVEAFFTKHDPSFLARMQAGHSGGRDAWKTVLAGAFDRWTRHSGYGLEDLRKITAPSLILSGDRDMCCSVEEGVAAFRMLGSGELAILPGLGHTMSPAAVEMSIEFLRRRGAE